MSVPGIVESALGDEPVAAQVGLGGEDELYVTPSRILIYRGEGLLSDAGVEEYPHRAERVDVSEGRRKAKITLRHDLEGDRSFAVQPGRLDDVLHPVLAGVLSTAGVTDAGETVKQTYRFSELTLIITSKRLVKHIGSAVWDADYEEFRFEDTTDLDFEEGSVATQIVLEVDGRRERIKAPNERAPEVRAQLEEALFDFYDVGSLEEFRATVAEAEGEATGSAPDPEETASGNQGIAFESDLSPLRTGPEDGDAADAGAADAAPTDVAGTTDQTEAGVAEAEVETADAGDPDAAAGGSAADAFLDDDGGGGGSADDPLAPSGAGDAAAGGGGAGGEAGQPQDPPAEGDQAPGQDAAGAPDEPVGTSDDRLDSAELERRLDEIARSVNKQNELLKRHQRTMEKLIDELQRMNE